jgi:hypothetical protein
MYSSRQPTPQRTDSSGKSFIHSLKCQSRLLAHQHPKDMVNEGVGQPTPSARFPRSSLLSVGFQHLELGKLSDDQGPTLAVIAPNVPEGFGAEPFAEGAVAAQSLKSAGVVEVVSSNRRCKHRAGWFRIKPALPSAVLGKIVRIQLGGEE